MQTVSMSKQPEKPWGAWLFKLFAFSGHPKVLVSDVAQFYLLDCKWSTEPLEALYDTGIVA